MVPLIFLALHFMVANNVIATLVDQQAQFVINKAESVDAILVSHREIVHAPSNCITIQHSINLNTNTKMDQRRLALKFVINLTKKFFQILAKLVMPFSHNFRVKFLMKLTSKNHLSIA
jgi:hypothetical protein